MEARKRPGLSRHDDVAKEIDFMLTRWERVTTFLNDGRIWLTNNAAKRTLGGLALGRNVWRFAASDTTGQRRLGGRLDQDAAEGSLI